MEVLSSETFKELRSIPAIATYIGTGISIFTFFQDELVIACSVLLAVVVVLFLQCLALHRKYLRFKKFKVIDTQLRKLTHRLSDYASKLRRASNEQEVKYLAAEALRDLVDISSTAFELLSGHKCTASVMLRVEDQKLATRLYSHNVDAKRLQKNAAPLSPDEGVASEAIRKDETIVWTAGHQSFKKTRDNGQEFYRSGVTAPFKVGDVYAGLLNIDSMSIEAFDLKDHALLATLLADCVAIVIETQQMRERSINEHQGRYTQPA